MAVITDMNVVGADTGGILQPFHKNRWSLEFQFFATGGDTRTLTAMAINAERPKLEFEEIQLDRYNSRAYLMGKHTFQPISVTFEPDIGGRVHQEVIRQLEQQQRLIGFTPDPANVMTAAEAGEDYKFGLVMTMLNGERRPLEKWFLDGCGLQNNDFGDLDFAASETVKTILTIRYDHARLLPLGRDKKATGGAAV